MDNKSGTKRCPRCKQTKSLDDFSYYYRSKSKKQTYCRVCNNEMDKIKRERIRDNGPTIIRTEKKCLDCNTVKDISSFGIRKNAPDWHLSYCKPCWVKKITGYQKKGL